MILAALCNMFGLQINASTVNTAYTNTVVVTTSICESQHEIDIGLAMQHDYVALTYSVADDNQISNEVCLQQSKMHDTPGVASEALADEQIEVGDQHIISITGGPSATMMANEDPNSIANIAPCEGERPCT